MSSRSSVVRIESTVLLRSVGITMVVFNHSHFIPKDYIRGGLNILLLVSGFALGRAAASRTAPEITKLFYGAARSLLIPSIILTAITGLLRQQNPALELLQISRWFVVDEADISVHPIWYIQMYLQLVVIFCALMWIFGLADRLRARPLLTMSVILALSLLMTPFGDWRLFPSHAWNLFGGWLIFIVTSRTDPKSTLARPALTVALIAAGVIVFNIVASIPSGTSRIIYFSIAVIIMVWQPSIPVPNAVRHLLVLVSHSTLYIFLLHKYVFSAILAGLGRQDTGGVALSLLLAFFGIVAPVALWLAAAALRRTRADLHDNDVVNLLDPRRLVSGRRTGLSA